MLKGEWSLKTEEQKRKCEGSGTNLTVKSIEGIKGYEINVAVNA